MNKITVREALRDAMAECMREDSRVMLMGEDVAQYNGSYKVSRGLLDEFGSDRVVDTPVSEMGFAGIAVGMAMTGLKPIVEFMRMDFSLQAIDHIVSTAAKILYMSSGQIGCPIVFRGPNGSAAGVGASHSQCLASTYAHVPGLVVIAPYDASSAKGLLKAAIRSSDPVVFLEQELIYGLECELNDEEYVIGKAKIVHEGSHVTIVTFSRMVGLALEAANIAKQSGISCEVIDLQTLRPMDTESILKSLKKTKRIITLEEGPGFIGVGAEIMALINEKGWHYLDAAPVRISGADVPMPYAKNLEDLCLPSVNDIVEAVKRIVE
jgi:pyruvate dehydrogenase E1 component beta subunit